MVLYIACLVMGDEVMVQPEGKQGKTVWVHKNDCKLFLCRGTRLPPDDWPEPSYAVTDLVTEEKLPELDDFAPELPVPNPSAL